MELILTCTLINSLFTNNLLYITHPNVIFPSLLADFDIFGEYITFKINISKTEALNISVPPGLRLSLKQFFPSGGYLGT